jgi:hypothetical protein
MSDINSERFDCDWKDDEIGMKHDYREDGDYVLAEYAIKLQARIDELEADLIRYRERSEKVTKQCITLNARIDELGREHRAMLINCRQEDDAENAEITRLNAVLRELIADHHNEEAKEYWLNRVNDCARNRGADEEIDPTPWCSGCGAIEAEQCECGPICENN